VDKGHPTEPAFVVACGLADAHSDWGEMESQCPLWLCLVVEDVEDVFMCLFVPLLRTICSIHLPVY
jgi:hypothetical protein